MEAKAILKTIRIAPRKVRLVVNQVRNKKVAEALSILNNTNKRSSDPVKKLIKSAIANGVNNNAMDAEQMFIKTIYVNEGPTIKRFRPRAHGRAYKILKRTSHITVTISDGK